MITREIDHGQSVKIHRHVADNQMSCNFRPCYVFTLWNVHCWSRVNIIIVL